MDILTIIIIILIYQFSQNLPLIHEILTVFIAFGILAIFWFDIVIFFTIATVFAAMIWFPSIFKIVYNLGIYHPLVERSKLKKSPFDEYDSEKILKVLKANLVVGASLFLVLLYIFNSFPSSFFVSENNTINKSVNQSSPIKPVDDVNIRLTNGAFSLTMLFVPVFLLSLRLMANPTDAWIKFVIETKNRSPNEIKNKVRYFKDQVISFYYSFIVGTAILFYFAILLGAYINGVSFDLLLPFMPKMDFYSIIFFVVIEILAVISTTVLGEWILKVSSPIDQVIPYSREMESTPISRYPSISRFSSGRIRPPTQ